MGVLEVCPSLLLTSNSFGCSTAPNRSKATSGAACDVVVKSCGARDRSHDPNNLGTDGRTNKNSSAKKLAKA